ncbi:MAG: hypothetical protein EXQ53_02930 [Acidobacteria bacterium]|nr:hypothetical protein [Acidobacteriota bacterium]
MSEPEKVAPHTTNLAVWDLPSPVVAGRRATLKVGIACRSGCDLTGTRIDIYDETGTKVGGGRLGSAPWPATTALYWAELDVAAPAAEGDHCWRLQATVPEPSHGQDDAIVRFVAVRPPEHRVTVAVIEKGRGVPLPGVELRLGRFRATTSEVGIAHLEVPGGTYDVSAWKIGYEMLSSTAHVAAGIAIRLEVAVAPEPEQPYWM